MNNITASSPMFPFVDFFPFFQRESLFRFLPKVSIVNPAPEKEFGLMARKTQSIEFDKEILRWNKTDNDEKTKYLERFKTGRQFLGIESILSPSDEELIGIIVAQHFWGAFVTLERALSSSLYSGTKARNRKESIIKELVIRSGLSTVSFDGIDTLCSSRIITEKQKVLSTIINQAKQLVKNNIDFVVCMDSSVGNLLGIKNNTIPLKINLSEEVNIRIVFDNYIPYNAITNDENKECIYIVPLAIDDEIVTRIEYIDQRTQKVIIGDYFSTDDGLLLWNVEVEKWDAQAMVTAETLLTVDRPDLITKVEFTHKWKKRSG